MKKILIGCLLAIATVGSSFGATETIRDSMNRVIGTVTTESNGKIIYRNSSNRQVGRAEYNSSTGITTYYDENGRNIGNSKQERDKIIFRNGSNSHLRDLTSSSTEKKVMVLDGKIQFFK